MQHVSGEYCSEYNTSLCFLQQAQAIIDHHHASSGSTSPIFHKKKSGSDKSVSFDIHTTESPFDMEVIKEEPQDEAADGDAKKDDDVAVDSSLVELEDKEPAANGSAPAAAKSSAGQFKNLEHLEP